MTHERSLLHGSEGAASTHVRSTQAPGEARAPLDSAGSLSGRLPYPLETWDPDDEPESELPVAEGELLGGKYRVERMFAEGGMGIVCLGRHVQLDQPVAIKFLRRTLSGRPEVVQRFLNEARALAALRSQHVVRVMDVGQLASGRPYLVMEHLDGFHLEQLLERDGPLGVETAIRYVLQVCEALAEAHALGIVHRDIKPENLFLWSGGPSLDIVKVLDFGLAKQLGSLKALGVTGPQDSLGSPYYMSPEQITTPQLVDARTDIWSLGVVLYRLLGNALPFEGTSLVEVFSHILNAAPVPLREASPSIDAELESIVLRCLEKVQDARYQTMSRLAEALTAYLAQRAPGAVASGVPGPLEQPALSQEAKLTIAGVHSRWPALLVALSALALGGVYQAERHGWLRVRELGSGWLTPARLDADAAPNLAPHDYEQSLPLFRSIYAAEPAVDGLGALTLRAVPERELAPSDPSAAPVAEAPISSNERIRRIAAYREYLKSQSLTPLREVLPTLRDDTAHAPTDDPAP